MAINKKGVVYCFITNQKHSGVENITFFVNEQYFIRGVSIKTLFKGVMLVFLRRHPKLHCHSYFLTSLPPKKVNVLVKLKTPQRLFFSFSRYLFVECSEDKDRKVVGMYLSVMRRFSQALMKVCLIFRCLFLHLGRIGKNRKRKKEETKRETERKNNNNNNNNNNIYRHVLIYNIIVFFF